MSLKLTRNMPPFEGVAASQTATARLPIGLTYHQVYVLCGNTAAGPGPEEIDITEIRVVANGEVIQRIAGGTLLDTYNKFDGRAAFPAQGTAGYLTIDFDRYALRTRAGEELTALGTGWPGDPNPVTTLSLEVDINSGATSPTLSAVARQSVPQELGLIKKLRTFYYSAAGAGDLEISTLPKGDLINRIFFTASANSTTKLRVERDNFTVFQRSSVLNSLIQTDGVRVPQAANYVYDPTETGDGAEGLVTQNVNDLRFILTTDGAIDYTVGVEYIGTIDL